MPIIGGLDLRKGVVYDRHKHVQQVEDAEVHESEEVDGSEQRVYTPHLIVVEITQNDAHLSFKNAEEVSKFVDLKTKQQPSHECEGNEYDHETDAEHSKRLRNFSEG